MIKKIIQSIVEKEVNKQFLLVKGKNQGDNDIVPNVQPLEEKEKRYLEEIRKDGRMTVILAKMLYSICAGTRKVDTLEDLARRDGMMKGIELIMQQINAYQKKEKPDPITGL